MEIIPYSLTRTTLPLSPQTELLVGQAQGVYMTLTSTDYQFILNKIVGWFRDRDEVFLVDHGASDKVGLGYIMVEWEGCAVDPLFLAILRDEDAVADYTVYTRDL